MKVYLPSSGALGIKSTEIRQPKIDDLRKVSELSQIPELRKTEFVKLFLQSPEQLDSMSVFDRDYLYLISVSAVHIGQLSFSFICDCGNEVQDTLDLSSHEVIFLDKSAKPFLTKTIEGINYQFHMLTVKSETEIVDYLSITDTETEGDYQYLKEDALVFKILYPDLILNDDSIKSVHELPLPVYFSALYFHQCCFHGVEPVKKTTCEACKATTMAVLDVTASLNNFNTAVIMQKFANLSSVVDFNSFINLSFSEYHSLINSLNNSQ